MLFDEFSRQGHVSRETSIRFRSYEELLRQWQARINLVSGGSLNDVWRRHFMDSLQLSRWISADRPTLDMGAGAGFPGMVLSLACDAPIVLAESDARKCAFLREVRRVTGAPAEIFEGRVETIAGSSAAPAGGFALIVARALAPLSRLLDLAAPLLAPGGRCLFLKGAKADSEIAEAADAWDMDIQSEPSVADPRGVILEIGNIARVQG